MIVQTKICKYFECSFLGNPQSIENFYKNSMTKDKFNNYCKKCFNCYYGKRYQKNKEVESAKHKIYYDNNKKKILETSARYKRNNKEKITKKHIEYLKIQNKTDLEFKLSSLLKNGVRSALKKQYGTKAYHTKQLIGCEVVFCNEYLINNYFNKTGIRVTVKDISIHGLHIDHIIPCKVFNLADSEQQKICFNYRNLQLLTAKENLKKRDKVPANVDELKLLLKERIEKGLV